MRQCVTVSATSEGGQQFLSLCSYLLYTAELAFVVARHGLNLHQYADDTQVYVTTLARDAEAAVAHLTACLVDIEARLKASRLRLNPTRLEFSQHAGQSQRLRSASGVDMHASTSQKRRVTTVWSSTASCCCHTGGRGVSQWLLPTTAASTARPIHVCRGGTYAGQGVHFVSPTVVPVFYFINFEFDIL